MRSINDQQFSEYIRRIGDGIEPFAKDDLIKVPSSMVIPWEGDHSIAQLIEQVFPDLQNHAYNARYMVDRALLTPINEDVDKLNEKIITQFPGEEQKLYSFDEVEDDTQHLYQQDFLNSISPGEILTGQYAGTRVFLPRIPLKITENVHLPFVMIRRQFPIRLSFALTINKAQGQTIPNIGIYLPDHVFSHGQLYVVLSRRVSQSTTKLLVQKGTIPGEEGVHTKNIVYKEILLHSS
ncbi:hypothetical protein SO802_032364 [Lithocarpus litseifolius]|uniref:ATP-dependent DNA helicase n=1 Tax=Lithocarpus litseifolius TaxID=425828 RepID=A0AAW2BP33_9ROSI